MALVTAVNPSLLKCSPSAASQLANAKGWQAFLSAEDMRRIGAARGEWILVEIDRTSPPSMQSRQPPHGHSSVPAGTPLARPSADPHSPASRHQTSPETKPADTDASWMRTATTAIALPHPALKPGELVASGMVRYNCSCRIGDRVALRSLAPQKTDSASHRSAVATLPVTTLTVELAPRVPSETSAPHAPPSSPLPPAQLLSETDETRLLALVHQQIEGHCFLLGSSARVTLRGDLFQYRICAAVASNGAVYRLDAQDAPADPIVFVASRGTRVALANGSKQDSIPAQGSASSSGATASHVRYADIGGLASQLSLIRETIELPLTSPEVFAHVGLNPPHGVLLFGPPGTGKTLIAKAVAYESGARVVCVNGPELVSKFYGETEAKLRQLFADARTNAPCIIFVDEIDALCPRRDDVATETERRVVGTLLTLMDELSTVQFSAASTYKHVMVIGATNRPNALDPALRRPGRFDREVEIGIPTANDRASILATCLRKMRHSLSAADIDRAASMAHGYVGADLMAVCKEAGLKVIRRLMQRQHSEQSESPPALGIDSSDRDDCIQLHDIIAALGDVKPSAMREVAVEIPKVKWADIGGMQEAKQRLVEAVQWPLQFPKLFADMSLAPPKGILLYGPPGCSKTLMAKALATESGLNFIAIKGPELFSKWVGESERAVRETFRKARAAAPSVIFFDEIDALAVSRGDGSSGGNSVNDRVLSQLLSELDGIEALRNVTILAATNRPELIDQALLRPGRIDRMMFVGPPDLEARLSILSIHLSKMPHSLSPENIHDLAAQLDGYSGAEVVAVCKEAGLAALEESMDSDCVRWEHFRAAVAKVPKRITPSMLQFYRNFQNRWTLNSIGGFGDKS